jgi:hypothetical protein
MEVSLSMGGETSYSFFMVLADAAMHGDRGRKVYAKNFSGSPLRLSRRQLVLDMLGRGVHVVLLDHL